MKIVNKIKNGKPVVLMLVGFALTTVGGLLSTKASEKKNVEHLDKLFDEWTANKN